VLNEHRRSRTTPLSNEEKRKAIREELKADPARSDRAIAAKVGVHNETVAAVRKTVTDSVTPCKRKSRTGKKSEGQRKVATTPKRQTAR
jgi:hypothetical protein